MMMMIPILISVVEGVEVGNVRFKAHFTMFFFSSCFYWVHYCAYVSLLLPWHMLLYLLLICPLALTIVVLQGSLPTLESSVVWKLSKEAWILKKTVSVQQLVMFYLLCHISWRINPEPLSLGRVSPTHGEHSDAGAPFISSLNLEIVTLMSRAR